MMRSLHFLPFYVFLGLLLGAQAARVAHVDAADETLHGAQRDGRGGDESVAGVGLLATSETVAETNKLAQEGVIMRESSEAQTSMVTRRSTAPYSSRFPAEANVRWRFSQVFSMANATSQIKKQMCEWYFKKDAHSDGFDCEEWVAQNVQVDDGPLLTARAGNPNAADVIVFIHGWPDTAGLWVNQFMNLSSKYYCIAVQLPNYLDALPTEELNLDEVVDRIGEVIGEKRVRLVGHDWGANFGYMVAYKFPEHVTKYAALDIGNDLEMWEDASTSWKPKAVFISLYQTKLAQAYREPDSLVSKAIIAIFARLGGCPSKYATARMGMYYDRAWNRDNFCKGLAPGVEPADWKSLWTPLDGTGIPQQGMLYLQGSNLATTDKFLKAVEDDGGRTVKLKSAGHWLPKDGAKDVNEELVAWLP